MNDTENVWGKGVVVEYFLAIGSTLLITMLVAIGLIHLIVGNVLDRERNDFRKGRCKARVYHQTGVVLELQTSAEIESFLSQLARLPEIQLPH